VRRLLVTANVVPSSPILVILMIEALRCSESSALIRTRQRNIPEDGILHPWGWISKPLTQLPQPLILSLRTNIYIYILKISDISVY
jgi:hypothetical protein